jgi:predicted amidohydrolase YtcJ
MKKMGITKDVDVEGVAKGPDGELNGELQEPYALRLADDIYFQIADGSGVDENWQTYGIQAKNAGCTTIGEMAYGSPADQAAVDRLKRIVDDPDYPVRIAELFLPLLAGPDDPEEGARWCVELGKQSTEKLRLGICANIFANHIYYWGDQHYNITVGPDRAERMDACATAKKLGVHFTLHSDAPITPINQLHSAWCAVNRLTATGRVLGEHERISVYDALYAVTLEAAYTLKMDNDVGSIEPGKLADFAVLEEDPFAVDPLKLHEIKIWGTVLGGKLFPATRR